MSLPRRFTTLLGVGVLLTIVMFYVMALTSGRGSSQDKGLKLMSKAQPDTHDPKPGVFSTNIPGSPTTPSRHTLLADHVAKTCRKLKLGKPATTVNPDRLDHILVDDKYKMLYCYVPKVACTNWRRVMLVLSGKVKVRNVLDIRGPDVHGTYKDLLPRLSNFSHSQIRYRLENYFKFMFVREPFERLLSAWRNKFQSGANAYFRKQFGQSILKRFRESDEEVVKEGVRFEEFLQYIVDPLRMESMNEHWATFQKLCLPCSVEYDFIGKYENMEEGASYVLKSVHADHVLSFPQRSSSYNYKSTSSYLASFYQNISAPLLRRVYKVYKKDFALFDYNLPAELQWVFR